MAAAGLEAAAVAAVAAAQLPALGLVAPGDNEKLLLAARKVEWLPANRCRCWLALALEAEAVVAAVRAAADADVPADGVMT